jgi:hypothetical protein
MLTWVTEITGFRPNFSFDQYKKFSTPSKVFLG